MVIVGVRNLVSRLNLRGHPTSPNASARQRRVLKITRDASIVISSIHLLRTFTKPGIGFWKNLFHRNRRDVQTISHTGFHSVGDRLPTSTDLVEYYDRRAKQSFRTDVDSQAPRQG